MPVDLSKRSTSAPPGDQQSREGSRKWIALIALLLIAALGAGVAIAKLAGGRSEDDRAGSLAVDPPAAKSIDPANTEVPDSEVRAQLEVTTVAGNGFAYSIPVDGWSLSDPRRGNDGRQIVRELSGPRGETVILVHTPTDRAKPDPSTVVGRKPLVVPAVSDAQLLILENFPTDACLDRLCDDFVLNHPAFGGLAILASDSGRDASGVARQIARSVAPA